MMMFIIIIIVMIMKIGRMIIGLLLQLIVAIITPSLASSCSCWFESNQMRASLLVVFARVVTVACGVAGPWENRTLRTVDAFIFWWQQQIAHLRLKTAAANKSISQSNEWDFHWKYLESVSWCFHPILILRKYCGKHFQELIN